MKLRSSRWARAALSMTAAIFLACGASSDPDPADGVSPEGGLTDTTSPDAAALDGPETSPDGGCVAQCSAKACGASDSCGGLCTAQTCSGGNQCVKGTCVAACPAGCYQGTSCMPGTTATACGTGGHDCAACTGLDACSTQSCRPSKVVYYGNGETWHWDGTAWTMDSTGGPSARFLEVATNLNGKFVLFGGQAFPGGVEVDYSETWSWDGMSWSQPTQTSPPGRVFTGMATLNGKAVLYSGVRGDSSGTWQWDGATWTKSTPAINPGLKWGFSIATLNGKVVLFGGIGSANVTTNETWTWDGTKWTLAATTGPSARFQQRMATLNGKIVLFGGLAKNGGTGADILADTWTWDGATWTEVITNVHPSARSGFGMATLNGKVVLYGGGGNAETWEWDGAAWTQRNVVGPTSSANFAIAGE